KQVFKELEFLGWYTTGGPPDPSDIHVHKQVCEIIESPLFLKLNPMTKHTDVRDPGGVPGEGPPPVPQRGPGRAPGCPRGRTLPRAPEGTRAGPGEGPSPVPQRGPGGVPGAVPRVPEADAVPAGEVPFNHEILREAYALCHCLPVLSTDKFKTDFYDQCNDVGLMAYLGTITKTCNTMNQFVNKFNILYDRQGIGRRMRGLFF
ncbi:COP9 signalosome complex subunit 6, partial [Eudyptes schlegeli]